MIKGLVTTAGVLAVLSGSMLIANRAEAGGGSASAPSKYAQSSWHASHQGQVNRQASRNDFPITEYSSSSARSHSH